MKYFSFREFHFGSTIFIYCTFELLFSIETVLRVPIREYSYACGKITDWRTRARHRKIWARVQILSRKIRKGRDGCLSERFTHGNHLTFYIRGLLKENRRFSENIEILSRNSLDGEFLPLSKNHFMVWCFYFNFKRVRYKPYFLPSFY